MSATNSTRRAVISTTAAMVFSGVLGFFAQLVLAERFGPGATLDAFLAVTTAPTALVGIGQTALLLAIVPPLAGALTSGNQAYARSLTRRAVMVAWLAAIIGLLFALFVAPPNRDLDIVPTFLAWLTCGFGLTAHVLAAVLATHGQFAAPVAMNSLYPASLIVTSVSVDSPGTRVLVGAYTVASVFHVAGLMFLSKLRDRTLGRLPAVASDASARRAFERFPWLPMLAGVAATLPSTVLPLSDVYWSTRLESGTLSLMALGLRLTIPLCALATSGLAYVTFPSIARTAAVGDRNQARVDVLLLGVAAFTVTVPIAAIGIAVRDPAVSLVLTRGHFTAEHAGNLSQLLPWYLLSIIGTGVSNAVLRSLFVFDMGRLIAMIAVAALVFYTVGSGLILHSAPASIAILYALTWTLFAGAQVAMLAEGVAQDARRQALRDCGVSALAAILAGVLSSALLSVWPAPLAQTLAASRLVVITVVGFGVYIAGIRRAAGLWKSK